MFGPGPGVLLARPAFDGPRSLKRSYSWRRPSLRPEAIGRTYPIAPMNSRLIVARASATKTLILATMAYTSIGAKRNDKSCRKGRNTSKAFAAGGGVPSDRGT